MTTIRQRIHPLSRTFILTVIGAVGFAGAVAADFLPQPPKATTPLEERGRHILQIASACGCHGANFAGWKEGRPDLFPRAAPFGERFVGTFGTIPASNITQDPYSGIRDWTDRDIELAITDGIAPGGYRLSPIMPSRAYHGMARSDVKALVAYLRRLRPVTNPVPERAMTVEPQAGADLPPAPDSAPTEPVALGRYLVENVSACVDCHAAEESAHGTAKLTGRVLETSGGRVLAPNLTTDRIVGIGRWSQRDIARYLRTGTRPDGGLAQSAMAGLILTSYSKLTAEEADAIAAYLKALPPERGDHK
ncbi:MAG: hypothetical protein V4671_12385 [Armatimonadota bacterium]